MSPLNFDTVEHKKSNEVSRRDFSFYEPIRVLDGLEQRKEKKGKEVPVA